MWIRKGDTVYVRSGQYRGKTGRVLHVNRKTDMLLVEGVNMKKKHQRPTQKNPKGGILAVEAPIHISNVALYSSSEGGPTRAVRRVVDEGGKKRTIRVCRRTGEEI
ncbi:MAG: 50S ribosomal protein L24 [Candidatus Zixiibacteriota bacterium]|nr:MAG: 50S ribosomal protein L24 [candidate division Zixibacteria bacterium]